MDSAILIPTRLRKRRRFFFGVGLAISLSTVLSYGQATTVSKNEPRPNAGDDASIPLTGGPPLTAREEEMLRLIKGLQERVARLEAKGGADGGDAQPAAQGDSAGSSQARLLEASIVGAVPQRANVSEKAAEPASVQATAGVKVGQTGPSSSPNQSNAYDKTEFPESSDVNPAIFGEVNPCRGFTLDRGVFEELILSCSMASRSR